MADLVIADDETEVRKKLEKELKHAGHSVRLAHDGLGALDTVMESAPDLLLVDWLMPVLTGGEVIERLRTDEKFAKKDIPIIGMTDLGDDKNIKVFIQRGADDTWMKDLSAKGIGELLGKIQLLLK
ncbi:MAG: response regulator [Candidatus Abyssobacteria bacterium SURF_5]|uniref:Response regulator n=1 Tax=Abyssobacteria bacterium (strain SURF_5) TaxID=2093360 RepID=A0A3A4NLI7_ABYX5|nr:MAG: response regulator [Candidatus Abyssubacteria bacterium SURF_5]